jgi:hypothetical protein
MYYGNIASCPAILQDGYLERAIRVITSFLISLCSSSRAPRILHSCRRCLPTPNSLTPRSIFRVTSSLIGSNPLKPQGFSNLFCSRTHQYVLPSETREGFQRPSYYPIFVHPISPTKDIKHWYRSSLGVNHGEADVHGRWLKEQTTRTCICHERRGTGTDTISDRIC